MPWIRTQRHPAGPRQHLEYCLSLCIHPWTKNIVDNDQIALEFLYFYCWHASRFIMEYDYMSEDPFQLQQQCLAPEAATSSHIILYLLGEKNKLMDPHLSILDHWWAPWAPGYFPFWPFLAIQRTPIPSRINLPHATWNIYLKRFIFH